MKNKSILLLALLILILQNIFPSGNLVFAASGNWYSSSWDHRKTITINNTGNSSTLSNYQIQIVVSYVSEMQTDFDDIRFADSDGTTLLDYWLETMTDSSSATYWVEIPSISGSSNKTIYMFYGNSNASAADNQEQTFLAHSDFSSGTSGDQSLGFEVRTAGGLTLDDDNNVTQSTTQGKAGKSFSWVEYSYDVNTGTGSDARTASRVPHQRQSFYANGRWWIFYSDYSTGTRPYNLYFITSADGQTWSSPTTTGTTIPFADAQWALTYDRDHNYVYVISNIQIASPYTHDGLKYRRGVPNSDGTITWSADWQTAVPTGSKVGDSSIAVDTNGYVWVGYDGGTGGTGQPAPSTVIKNANTDGTWSTAAGFPVELDITATLGNPILSPLSNGGMHVTNYTWDSDAPALGFYSADGSSTFTSEGSITSSNVEANSGAGARVGRIDAGATSDGVVHIIYQDDSGNVKYRKRNANGAFESEVALGQFSQTEITSPRISFDLDGKIYVTYTAFGTLYLVHNKNGSWSKPYKLLSDFIDNRYEHLMPAELVINERLSLIDLTSTYILRHRLIDFTPSLGSSLNQSMYFRKASTASSSENLYATMGVPDLNTGDILQFDLYATSVSSNNDGDNNDYISFSLKDWDLVGSTPIVTTTGPIVALYGDGLKIGYFDTENHKSQAINVNQWYSIGMKIKASNTFDLLVDGSTIASNIAFYGAPSKLETFVVETGASKHTGQIYIDNILVRKWTSPEPSYSISSSVDTYSSDSSSSNTPSSSCSDKIPGAKTPWLYGAIAQNSSSILLYFTEASDPVDKYFLEYGIKSGEHLWGSTNIGGQGTRTYLVKELSPKTTYFFRVRAGNGCATGEWSNEISAKTTSSGIATLIGNLDIVSSELKPVQPETQSDNFCKTHTVQAGDSLWSIAKELLGDGNKYSDLISLNKEKYPSLETSTNLEIDWVLKTDCIGDTKDTKKEESENQEAKEYSVNIKVVNTEGNPIKEATVTIHSKVQTAKTDGFGMARFENVEEGDHRVIIAYSGYEGEQSINLTGDVKEFALDITIQTKSVWTSPQLLGTAGVLVLIIAALGFAFVRAKSKI